jgi:hypothetical protein
MKKLGIIALTLACVITARAADNKSNAEARAQVIAPYVDEGMIAIVHADLSRLSVQAVLSKLGNIGNIPAADLQMPERMFSQWVEKLEKAGGKDIFFVVSLTDFSWLRFPAMGFVIVPLEEGADGKTLASILGTAFQTGAKLPGDKAVFGGPTATWERVKKMKPVERPELVNAFAAAGDTAIQVLLLPNAEQRRVIEEMAPRLPKELGAGPTRVVTQGALWTALGIDLTPKLALSVVAQSRDGAAATALHDLLKQAAKALGEKKEVLEDFPGFAEHSAPFIPRVSNDQLTAKVTEDQLAAILKPAIAKLREASERTHSLNNLRQIGIAMHTYNDVHKALPTAASYDKQGKPLLSWRVHILPYIESDKLYKEFHLDEPWDSEHNKKLIARMPRFYQSANRKLNEAGKTRYLAPLGKETMFPGRQPISIPKDVPDGTSQTILIVEALESQAVIWTNPDDLPIDLEKPLKGLVDKNKWILAVFADASVHMLPATIDPKTLRALFTRNGGEVVGPY